jgi:hypothetical protein
MKTPGAWLHNGRLLMVAIACLIVAALGYDVHWEPEPPTVQVEFVPTPTRSVTDWGRTPVAIEVRR